MKYFNETYKKRQFVTRNEWADTYRAIHAITEKNVLLKVLVRKSKDEEYINHLLKEVEIVKNIKNPNLINVNNMFRYSGCGKIYYYIEGEYFKGVSLKEKLVEGKLNKNEAIKIVESMALGIKELHEKNIQFNNLNLDNILINSKNIVKINLLSYLEDKNFEKKENLFDPEEDIYDLGVILYSILSGKSIFDKIKYKEDIDEECLISIIERATDKELEDKYKNINRLIVDLKSYLKSGTITENNYDYNEKNSKKDKIKKGKLQKTIGACAAIGLVTGAVVYGYDFVGKNNNYQQGNNTNISEELVKSEVENKKEENKTTISNNISSNKSTETNSSVSNSKKKNNSKTNINSSLSNSNSSINNSSGNNSNTNKPNNNTNEPNNNQSIEDTSKPDKEDSNEENINVEQSPDVNTEADNSTDNSVGESTTETSEIETENE